MDSVTFDKKGTIKYLIWTFVIAWGMQIIVAVLNDNGLAAVGQLLMVIMMFAPLTGVRLAGQKLVGMGWKPRLKGKIGILLMAWFFPALLTAAGAVLYFLIFPQHFDLSGEYMIANVGEDAMEQLEAQGLTYPLYILVTAIAATIFAPLTNMFAAIGEEAGWRGFLYPQLKARFGKRKGWLIGGVIWAAWHFPLMWLIGYEYGKEYVGFPIVGMLIFCIFATTAGILCDWLYEKSGCIWVPSICHGAINAVGTVPPVLCIVHTGSAILLGPAPIGIIGGLPLTVLAIVLLLKSDKPQGSKE